MESYWQTDLHTKLLSFLEHQQDEHIPGYFRYSLSGDLFTNKPESNLAGSIFALKLYHMLAQTNVSEIDPVVKRVLSFQKGDGTIYDPFVSKHRFIRNVLSQLKHGSFHNFTNQGYIRAETRQVYSALLLHNIIPERIYTNVPTSPEDVKRFLTHLDWTRPWEAGSHFSHLMFFLSLMKKAGQLDQDAFALAQQTALNFVQKLQHQNDGAWYKGEPSVRQKINGAMKLITGLTVNDLTFSYPEQLIDLCLSQQTNAHDACDQINQILVLRYASALCSNTYRSEGIRTFCLQALDQWQSYYHPRQGGFSFYKHKANHRYYGAKVSLGKNEPDIHGTVLFVWGLSLINQILHIPELSWIQDMKS